jgi:DNA-directed RNA polymerase subunit beta'
MAGKEELDGKSGPEAIREKLEDINVDQRLRQLRRKMDKTEAPASLAKMRKETRYLEALQANEMTPSDAYLMSVVPVLPPSMRPVSVMDGGDLNTRDINGLYKYLAISNRQLREFDPGLPETERKKLQAEVYDDLRALTLTGKNINKQQYRGVMETMKGVPQPKDSFFQKNLISRKQDLSMRSIIIPEPAMGLDEVGIPYSLAKETYKPFVVRKLRLEQGMTPLEGQKEVEKGTELARRTLERVLEERPVLLKRDPVLHKFGIMAFQPKVVGGKAIRIHPLVTGGYNADFDGDAMSAYVPLTHEAVNEAHKMFPSRNLFSPTSGRLMYQPGHEAQLGLYRLTKWGDRTGHEFKSEKEAAKDAAELGLGMTDVITVAGKETTLGRLLINRALPKGRRGDKKLLHQPSFLLDKGEARKLLTDLAEKHPNDFGESVNQLKDLGNNYAYQSGFSVSLRDFSPQRAIRDRILGAAHREVAAIHKRRDISEEKREELAAAAYQKATNEMTRVIKPKLSREKNNALELVSSGARGDWDQLRQIVVAPMLIKDAADRPIPIPITKSYAEGLDTASYFTTMQGARKTMIQKTKETAKPGALTKDIVNSAMNMLIIPGDAPDDSEDGIFLDTESREIIGRFLSKPAKLRTGETLPRNTELTPEVITRIRNAGAKRVSVRSPLRSAAAQGLYARDYGTLPGGELPEPGTNIGIIAAQALGEPATQLSMKAFHHGGVASTKGKVTDSFTRVENLLQMPATLPDSATLAERGGRISRIEKDKDAGGLNVWVEDQRHYVPEHLVNQGLHLRKGVAVKRGDRLSAGPINPHELLPLTNVNTVRNYLTDEVHTAYKDSGVQRRNAEAVIRAITNLGVVRDPAGDPTLLKGDLVSVSQMEARNRKSKRPVTFKPVLRGVNQTPLDMQTDWMARMQYQRLQDTVVDAALKNWGSDLHGMHPVPGMAYGAEFGKPALGVTSFKY